MYLKFTYQPPFYKENLMTHLHEINGADDDATCIQLRSLDIICLPSEITHTGEAPAEKIEIGHTSTATDKDLMQDLIMQDSQDPNEDMQEIDPEEILFEAELKEYKKRESRNERANLSPSHDPIFKW